METDARRGTVRLTDRAAPSGFWRLGEYQGLAAFGGRGFAAVFTMAAPQAQDGPTDIFFARIGPGNGSSSSEGGASSGGP